MTTGKEARLLQSAGLQLRLAVAFQRPAVAAPYQCHRMILMPLDCAQESKWTARSLVSAPQLVAQTQAKGTMLYFQTLACIESKIPVVSAVREPFMKSGTFRGFHSLSGFWIFEAEATAVHAFSRMLFQG